MTANRDAAPVTRDGAVALQVGQDSVERLTRQSKIGRDVLELPPVRNDPIRVRCHLQPQQDPLAGGPNVPKLETSSRVLQLMRHRGEKALGLGRVAADRTQHLGLRIDKDTCSFERDRVAMVDPREKGRFGKQLAWATRVQDDKIALDRAPLKPNPASFDTVDRRRRVALPEQNLAS